MIRYDKQIEVTRSQYAALQSRFGGMIATRYHDGKFYVKVWRMKYRYEIKHIISIS